MPRHSGNVPVELVRVFSSGHTPRAALFMAYGDTFLSAGVAMLACAAGGLLLKPSKTVPG